MRYLLLIAITFTTPCIAQYKCVENGRTTYAERPCSPAAKAVELPRDNQVTQEERAQAAERLRRQKKIAGEIDTMNAAEQEKQKRRGEVFAEQERLKRERCAELVKLAKGADDDSKTYRYHQGLIDDANRRKKEAEAAHFTECYGRYR